MNLRRSLQVGLAALAVPALLLFPGARDARAADVSIFAAASLKPVLDALAADPELQIEGADLRLVYAGSSALARPDPVRRTCADLHLGQYPVDG